MFSKLKHKPTGLEKRFNAKLSRKKFKLVCSNSKCPRTLMVEKQDTDHPKAKYGVIGCPWHEEERETVDYYDENNNLLTDDFLNP